MISFICQPILATFVNVSLKCGQDWLKDEEVENREVTMVIFFGVLALVCFDVVDTSCRSSFITMKLHIYTQDCCHDEPDSSDNHFTANCDVLLRFSTVLVTAKHINVVP